MPGAPSTAQWGTARRPDGSKPAQSRGYFVRSGRRRRQPARYTAKLGSLSELDEEGDEEDAVARYLKKSSLDTLVDDELADECEDAKSLAAQPGA